MYNDSVEMGKKAVGNWGKHILEILAIILLGGTSLFLGSQWTKTELRAYTAADVAGSSGCTIAVELTDNQPQQLVQSDRQWVAQFRFSTTSPTAVAIASLVFYASGDLRFDIVKRPSLAPLSVEHQSRILGTGSEWIYNYGLLQQQIILESPLLLSKDTPVTMDIYANLFKLRDRTFGVELASVDSSIPVEGLPLAGRLYKIKKFI